MYTVHGNTVYRHSRAMFTPINDEQLTILMWFFLIFRRCLGCCCCGNCKYVLYDRFECYITINREANSKIMIINHKPLNRHHMCHVSVMCYVCDCNMFISDGLINVYYIFFILSSLTYSEQEDETSMKLHITHSSHL